MIKNVITDFSFRMSLWLMADLCKLPTELKSLKNIMYLDEIRTKESHPSSSLPPPSFLALCEGGVAGVEEGPALWSGAFPLQSARR